MLDKRNSSGFEKGDYTKYLSYDNGKGLLLNKNDIFVLEQYGIDYSNCFSISDLIFQIGEFIDDSNWLDDMEDLEEVLCHLKEMHYYNETKK